MLFKNPVRTSKRTPHITITKINWLMLFEEIIAVYSENHTKRINTLCVQKAELLIVTDGGSYRYNGTLKGLTLFTKLQFLIEIGTLLSDTDNVNKAHILIPVTWYTSLRARQCTRKKYVMCVGRTEDTDVSRLRTPDVII
jgi:hypothetical protein